MGVLSRVSYLLVSLILVAVAIAATILLDGGVVGQIGTLTLVAVLVVLWIAARRGDVTPADPEKKLRRSRNSGRPVIVHFFSDYHVGSLLGRPSSAKLEAKYRGRFEFIEISAFHPEAEAMMESLKANIGDYVFFDTTGKLVGQYRSLAEDQMQRFLEIAP